ncbi:TetR/AcrR family transcriptional regulator [Mycolicibacterium celeriflavum]|uniref:Putative transcriptional regulator, TetR family protein n=1 Tax=Mycolicibacterium celeriflavum TaxID=1249101 RepID=A0A1X0BS76_MYCCF|nr:TetR/AcrR family transcriptional regulator [Mycolicibacterium celeriflavum]MCV7240196.1 TetR/AcrR family transcriptional regulator [Mycolicibacterium celeriflavum]ORA46457.1 TetR family transcriptional regulator [Mycolicibacterium celeriflavum]BBY46419.1 putative transcriptional regulator, TetR family protein [Mycolicibacterium celeriflavum]
MASTRARRQASGDDPRSSIERIRGAALKCFAARGAAATSLRLVAAEAGVSLGLVQHHFATKANLIKAVDDHVLAVIETVIAKPIPEPPADTITDIGNRVTSLVADEPDVLGYVGRALTDGSTLGAQLFDSLAAIGAERWQARRDLGLTRPDLDPTWGTLNPLVLALGTWILRGHIERHLPEPFDSPSQLQRWQDAVNALLRDGQMRHDP